MAETHARRATDCQEPVECETATPFKRPILKKANEAAAKFNTPLFDLAFKGLIFIAPILFAFFWSSLKDWGAAQVVASPVIMQALKVNDARLVTVESTNAKIAGALADLSHTAQEVSSTVAVVNSKLDDMKQQTRQDISRIDARLDSIQRNQ